MESQVPEEEAEAAISILFTGTPFHLSRPDRIDMAGESRLIDEEDKVHADPTKVTCSNRVAILKAVLSFCGLTYLVVHFRSMESPVTSPQSST